MRNAIFTFLLFLVFSFQSSAQWTDFPVGYDAIPTTKLKGKVHSVLTIEQRGEKVFGTDVEIYDKNGSLIESLSSNAGIEVHSGGLVRLGGKRTFTYDSSGKLVKRKYFTPEGEYKGFTNYNYNTKNFLVEDNTLNIEGKETSKTTYTYFPNKREVEVKWSVMKVLLTYNEKNQWTKRSSFDSYGNIDGFITFEYDSLGNLVKEDYGRYWHNYNYKFDKQGNWIERQNNYIGFDEKGEEKSPSEWMRTYRIITYYSDNETKP